MYYPVQWDGLSFGLLVPCSPMARCLIGFLGRWGTYACPQCLPGDSVPIRSWTRTLWPPGIRHRHLPYHTIPSLAVNYVALLLPLRAVQFSSASPTFLGAYASTHFGSTFLVQLCMMLVDFIGHYLLSSIITFTVQWLSSCFDLIVCMDWQSLRLQTVPGNGACLRHCPSEGQCLRAGALGRLSPKGARLFSWIFRTNILKVQFKC